MELVQCPSYNQESFMFNADDEEKLTTPIKKFHIEKPR